MLKEVFVVVSILGYCLGATLEHCPEGSSCYSATEKLETTSFEFLDKLSQKDFRSIVSLTISNASINKVDPKLKYLKSLAYLDLSYNSVQISSIPSLSSLRSLILKANDLKYINISLLPPNIEYLDLSDNLLSQISKEWRSLKNLKSLNLYKNPIDCDCNNVLNYELLNKNGIIIPKPLKCYSPSKYAGKEVSAVNCTLADTMQYDEFIEGSGDPDIFDESFTELPLRDAFSYQEEDEDNSGTEVNTIIDDKDEDLIKTTTLDPLAVVTEYEGSGDVGSGFGIISDTGVLGCIENCEIPTPIPTDPTDKPVPSLIDQLKILSDDINIFKEPEPSTTTTTSTTTTSTSTTSTTETTIEVLVPVKEPKLFQENKTKDEYVEDINPLDTSNTTAGLERASSVQENSTSLYVIIGVGVFIAILFIIVFIKNRKAKKVKNTRRMNIASLGEEMKPLSKPLISTANDKPDRNSSKLPEQTPLINGQNGKPRDDTPKLKSFTPLAHPELPNDDDEYESPVYNGMATDPEEVDLRPKAEPVLLTPQRERVTIRESEIPESIPRTPLLVHRQKNSDGEIVTTPVS